jgi:hypothetical protein
MDNSQQSTKQNKMNWNSGAHGKRHSAAHTHRTAQTEPFPRWGDELEAHTHTNRKKKLYSLLLGDY